MVSNLMDPSCLLAASGGDTIKIFDVSANSDDRCVLSYTPSPGCAINNVKWSHTNVVVASTGEDEKISLWRENGQRVGTVPVTNSVEECLSAISFSTKGSRYLCSGGTGKIVKIWDLQKKLCIKQLKGHTSKITGVMYNCKDEHLASVSDGDLIVHNLVSGAMATKLKDPDGQVLSLLDYSRFSRHLLVTAGDDGTVRLWDTTRRSPKISWPQHSAPTAGVCFSPSNEKIIASVGMDKKLYTYDSGSRKPLSCIAYEAPFSSLAFGDNGYILAAGTNDGKVVVYDIRGKPQPVTILKAFKKVRRKSLSWQTSKPVIVNEKNCTSEMALFGSNVEDSIVIPDPLPSTASSARQSALAPGSHGASASTVNVSSIEQTPKRTHLRPGGTPSRQRATGDCSPDIDVSYIEEWADREGLNNNPSSLLPSSSSMPGNNLSLSPLFTQGITAPGNIDSPRRSPNLTRRSYAERISNTTSFSEGASPAQSSPKIKKSGAETREDVLNKMLPRPETIAATETGAIPLMTGGLEQSQTDQQQVMASNSFTLQLSQRTLEDTLDSFKNSIHDDVRNLHTEILRQFHMHEMEMYKVLNSVVENQAEQMKELKLLRKENQELRQRL